MGMGAASHGVRHRHSHGALSACPTLPQYINFLAGFSDYLALKGFHPIMMDVWGGGHNIVRTVMWLFTTPVMVYLLSILSDFSWNRVRAMHGAGQEEGRREEKRCWEGGRRRGGKEEKEENCSPHSL
jgi:hypothetical protein